MHELSIALNILELAGEEAERHQSRVTAVHLKLGVLSGVVPEALTSAFELARQESAWPACRLVVEEVPLVLSCTHCGGDMPAESIQSFRCAACGTPSNKIVRGSELELVALELET